MKRIIKPHNSLFWSIVFGMAMLALMLPLRPHSSLSVRAQPGGAPSPAGMVGRWPGDGDANDIQGATTGRWLEQSVSPRAELRQASTSTATMIE